MKIIELGKSIRKIVLDAQGKQFNDLFGIARPKIIHAEFTELTQLTSQLIILKVILDIKLIFRGQFEFLEDKKQILFIGSPWFDSSEALNQSGLLLNDYAPHAQMVDLLHVLKSQEIANEDLKEVLKKLDNQKSKLEKAQQELHELTQSLKESNFRYEIVNKATSEAIWDWNVITGEVYYGEGFFKLFGYQTLNLPQNFNIWESRIHPEDFERISHSISAMILSKETNWTDEYRYLKYDKTYANVIDKGFILRDQEGHALRMIGSMQDVTIQKKEEEHLKLLESVITNAHDSVLITEAVNDHPIIFVNKAFTTMTGYEFEEVKGKNPRFLQGPNSDKTALKKVKDAMSNWEACEITTKNYRKNGEEFWINFSISPVKNQKGEYTHWISIERDVSDIIKANTEIENQKKFTEDILNNIPTDIAVFDVNHNYLFVNPHGIKNPEIREWIINKNDFDYTKMRNIDDTLARQRWQLFEDAVESKKKVEWIDEHKNKEGEDIYILRNFYPYFENEKLKFIIGYGIDITERKVIEIKLNEAIESIKKSNNELEQFAYVASHDLQEPLRMVTSFLSQLEKKYGEQLDDKAKEYIFYAVDGAKRMRQIILDLLEYSRVGKNEGQINEIDINNVIEEIKVLHSKQIEELNAIITYENMPVVKGNKTPVRQIFLNLISNALKYIRKGIAPEISINCIDHAESWEFIIKDNGIGIEPEFYEKIFIIFQRLHNKDEFSGTGIGLAITKKIIDNMGGRIWVSTNDDYGSTFHFTIPKNKK